MKSRASSRPSCSSVRLASAVTETQPEGTPEGTGSQHLGEASHTDVAESKPECESAYNYMNDAPMMEASASIQSTSLETLIVGPLNSDGFDDEETENLPFNMPNFLQFIYMQAEEAYEEASSTGLDLDDPPLTYTPGYHPYTAVNDIPWGDFSVPMTTAQSSPWAPSAHASGDVDMSDSEGGAPLDDEEVISNGPPPWTDVHLDEVEEEGEEEEMDDTGGNEVEAGAQSQQHENSQTMQPSQSEPDTIYSTEPSNPATVPMHAHFFSAPQWIEADEDFTLFSNPNPTMLGSVNQGLFGFVRGWAQSPRQPRPAGFNSAGLVPHMPDLRREVLRQVQEVNYRDLEGDFCDMQGVNWRAIGTTRKEARKRRWDTYRNYVNVEDSDTWKSAFYSGTNIPSTDSFMRFKRMSIRQDVNLTHFQLRSTLACPSMSEAYFTSFRGVSRMNLIAKQTDVVLDMCNYSSLNALISSLDAKDNILMAGSFQGEYWIKNLASEQKETSMSGRLTNHTNGITNHLQIHETRSGRAMSAIACNDLVFRMLDLETGEVVVEASDKVAMNCSTTSPDRRLRVMVGDDDEIRVTNAETGELVHKLQGHADFGFACDWSDDGWTVATAYQDRTIKIWDARYWRDSDGNSTPLTTIRTDQGTVRNLRFSALGTGPRILVAAEEADYVHFINAQTFQSKQTIDVFGELGGVAFTNDGHNLNVLSCDHHRGGILQLERCGSSPESFFETAVRLGYTSDGYTLDDDPMARVDELSPRRPNMMDEIPIF